MDLLPKPKLQPFIVCKSLISTFHAGTIVSFDAYAILSVVVLF
jgi:hypothetical protein